MKIDYENLKHLKPLRSFLAPLFLFGSLSSLALAVDTDADGLEDDWEIAQFGDLNQDGTGDTDGDGYTNEQEETLGLDANVSGGVPGYLLHEMWTGLPGIEVEDLVNTDEFRQSPNMTELLLGVENSPGLDNYGSRLRGTITAPVTGSYTFWESGDDGVELWISSDDRKFLRQRIAWHSGNTGQLVWDKFSTQQSAPISLQAGQKYYLEALHKEQSGGDYVALAWSYEADDLVNWVQEPGVSASQSSTVAGGVASRAIDGNRDGLYASRSTTYTNPGRVNSWWEVDLGADRNLERVILYNRTDGVPARLSNFTVSVLDDQGAVVESQLFHSEEGFVETSLTWDLSAPVVGRKVRVQLDGVNLNGDGTIHLAEVEVMGSISGAGNATPLGYLTNWTQESGVAASQSSTVAGGVASRAVDGNRNGVYGGKSVTYTNANNQNAWWQVNLGVERPVKRIAIYNRVDNHMERLSNFRVVLLDNAGVEVLSEDFYTLEGHVEYCMKWDLPVNVDAQTVRIERLGPNRGGDYALHFAEVEVLGEQGMAPGAILAREVIPTGAIESFAYDVDDQDDDDLFDAWEQTYGFDLSTRQNGDYAYGADPDFDYITNGMESELGLDPFQQNSLQGSLTLEQRFDIPSYSVREAAVKFGKIYEPADEIYFVESSTTGEVSAGQFAQRMRGYILAPETGAYRFWISASNAGQLLLSTGEDKFSKRIIAELGPEVGTGHGQFFNAPNKWDQFVSQMSEEVHLVEGQKYFIEVLHQHGHGSSPHADVAWARPNAAREEIPATHFYSYYQLAADADDDSLLDSWESQYGLSITDNGLIDRAHEGENGDFDEDGLSNREEYIAGTNPANSDSDGDGISDFDELRSYGTDPLISDATAEALVDTIDLLSVPTFGDKWVESGSGGLLATSFRGSASWSFNVPSEGHWVVQMSAQMRGDLRFEESLPVIASINGNKVLRSVVFFRREVPGTLRFLTPWLPAGQHEFSLFIDNNTTRRSLEVNSIKILTPGGVDLDNSGLPDWADYELAQRSNAWVGEQFSYISPAFIEGDSPSENLVDLTTINRSGETNRQIRFTAQQMQNMLPGFESRLSSYASRLQSSMRNVQIHPTWYHHNEGRMEGSKVPHQSGPGTKRWFTKIDLPRNEAIGYVSQFENLGTYQTGTIAWMPANVFTVDHLTIPVGSKLLLGAWIQDWDWRSVTLNIAGQNYSFPSMQTHVEEFTTAGSYLITATHQDGQTATLNVDVRDAVLPDHLAVGEQQFFESALPNVAADLNLDTNGEIPHTGLVSANPGSTARLAGKTTGQYRAAVRLTPAQTGGRGTILNQTETYVVGVSDALRNMSDIVSPLDADLFLIRSPLIILNLPPGATIEAVVFAGGVTFPDGTTLKTLTAADLDDNGVHTFEFHIPRERLGAPCHYINIHNAAGQTIWSNTQ